MRSFSSNIKSVQKTAILSGESNQMEEKREGQFLYFILSAPNSKHR